MFRYYLHLVLLYFIWCSATNNLYLQSVANFLEAVFSLADSELGIQLEGKQLDSSMVLCNSGIIPCYQGNYVIV